MNVAVRHYEAGNHIRSIEIKDGYTNPRPYIIDMQAAEVPAEQMWQTKRELRSRLGRLRSAVPGPVAFHLARPVSATGRLLDALENMPEGFALFDRERIERMAGHLDRLLATLQLLAAQAHEPAGQQVLGDRQAGRDVEVSPTIGTQSGDGDVQLLGRVQHPICPLHDQLTGRRQLRAAATARDEGFPDEGLHRADPGRGRLLADAQLDRGGAQTSGAGDQRQQLQSAQIGDMGTEHSHKTTL